MILEVKNGTFGYGKADVIKKINFKADSGDLLAILGPNGAGKTTLLRAVMGFLKWKSGASYIGGVDIKTLPQSKLWQQMAYVPQARGAASAYTVREMVLLGRSSHIGVFSKPSQNDIVIAEDTMQKLHIAHLAEKKCSQISGGELQMVLIARAMAAQPEILILDEPESNLDFKNQLIVLETLSSLTAKGMTCVFNTHYPAHALTRANKALILNSDGSSIFGNSSEIVTQENIQKAFGVRAVIGEIETDENVLKNVVAVEVSDKPILRETDNSRSVAVISVITDDFEMADNINEILHEYGSYLIGRMGMPYHSCGLYIINVTLDAPKNKVETLAARLGTLHRVSVKTTYARGDFKAEEAN